MAGQSWSIKIIAGDPCAVFVPDVYSPPGTAEVRPLQAQLGDLVSWNNQTGEEHEIWLTNAEYEPQSVITDRIAAYESSYPGYVPQQADITPVPPDTTQTIYYYCSIHNAEHGQITVVS
jgi:plastocyanin